MNIKVNNMRRADFWLNKTVNALNSFNMLHNTTFEFDAYYVEKLNRGC